MFCSYSECDLTLKKRSVWLEVRGNSANEWSGRYLIAIKSYPSHSLGINCREVRCLQDCTRIVGLFRHFPQDPIKMNANPFTATVSKTA